MTSDRPDPRFGEAFARMVQRADSEATDADIIESLAVRITELEQENAALRAQFKDADEVAAEFADWHGGTPPEGWTPEH